MMIPIHSRKSEREGAKLAGQSCSSLTTTRDSTAAMSGDGARVDGITMNIFNLCRTVPMARQTEGTAGQRQVVHGKGGTYIIEYTVVIRSY